MSVKAPRTLVIIDDMQLHSKSSAKRVCTDLYHIAPNNGFDLEFQVGVNLKLTR
jgi:hypothetical protein